MIPPFISSPLSGIITEKWKGPINAFFTKSELYEKARAAVWKICQQILKNKQSTKPHPNIALVWRR